MTRTILHVSDMDCPVEMQLITAGLGRRPGIEKLDFDLIRREVTVTHSLADPQILAREIRALGLQAELRLPTDGKPEATPVLAAGPLSLGWPLLVSGAAALAAEILAWTQGHGHAHDHGAHGGAEGTPPLIVGLAALSVACGGWQTLRKGWTALRRLTLNIHFLMMLAVAGAVAIGEWPEAA
ncbi:MAG: heavy metal translocating P-type ATPase, partial [Armatimonadetes bacterium]|nr:heavy metal translocating P-type ATPase [Armatimonadota bacterium]